MQGFVTLDYSGFIRGKGFCDTFKSAPVPNVMYFIYDACDGIWFVLLWGWWATQRKVFKWAHSMNETQYRTDATFVWK